MNDERKQEAAPAADASSQWVEMGSVSALGRASAVLDNLSQGLVVIDPETRELYWNGAARRLYGFDAEPDGGASPQLREFFALFVLDGLDGTPLPPAEWPIPRLLRGEKVEDVFAICLFGS